MDERVNERLVREGRRVRRAGLNREEVLQVLETTRTKVQREAIVEMIVEISKTSENDAKQYRRSFDW